MEISPWRSKQVALRKTKEQDLDYVLKAESDARNARFIIGWSEEQHRKALKDPNVEHWILMTFKQADGLVSPSFKDY